MKACLVLFLNLVMWPVLGQSLSQQEIKNFADEGFLDGLITLRDFLKLSNIGSNPSDIDQNLAWCEEAFAALDFKTSTLTSEGVKHLLAEKTYRSAAPTILIYMQIDGQPVDPAEWDQPDPFDPVVKDCSADHCTIVPWKQVLDSWQPDWKLFARSASDSKGPAVAFIQALRILKQQGMQPAFNLKIIMDFQEELGSPTLPALVENNRERFAAEAMLIMDGTRPPGNLPNLTFGARGIATLKLTVFGARRNLHSGQYGNFAPNPAFGLSRLLAGMKDESGKVLIPGFYDGVVLSDAQKKLINQVPENREELLLSLGIHAPESVGNTYQEALQYPSLNVRGLKAAWVNEEVRTIIPAEAIAEIDMRLVPETPAERQIQLVRKYIEDQGYMIIDSLPTEEQRKSNSKLLRLEYRIGSKPFKTPLDSPIGVWLGTAMERTFGEGGYVNMQSTGGSQPIAPFITTLGVPAVSVRIPNPENSIHAPNENLRLGNFLEGVQTCLGILTQAYE